MEKLPLNKFILLASKYGVEFADWDRSSAEHIVAERMKLDGDVTLPVLDETTTLNEAILKERSMERAEMAKFFMAIKTMSKESLHNALDYPILADRFRDYIGDLDSHGKEMKEVGDVCNECENRLLELMNPANDDETTMTGSVATPVHDLARLIWMCCAMGDNDVVVDDEQTAKVAKDENTPTAGNSPEKN